ncbi:kinetochore protein Nuf2 isoform X1 [Lepisosteus oculatus]|uniref:kinetochore protein Nuf2 isoform X1 n=2 Tax=Lepisosteus oculatus TaxID=7918 RepID=UPI0037208AE9
MDENTFPLYKVDSIVQFLRNNVLDENITKNDITPIPKPEIIQRLYMKILHQVFGFRPEFHGMTPVNENTEYSAILEGVTPIFSVYVCMCQFLPMCHIYDFQLNDIISPKVKRTICILSGIMNFLHFRNLCQGMLAETQQTYKSDVEKLQSLLQNINKAEKKVQELMTIPPEQQAQYEELAAALADLQSQSCHGAQEAEAFSSKITELKTDHAERTQKLNQMKVQVATLKEDIAKLRSQIVEPPEEIKKEKEKMKETVKNVRKSKEKTDVRFVELQIKNQTYNQYKAEIQSIYKLLQDLQSAMDEMYKQQEEIHILDISNEKAKKELKNLFNEESRMKRALHMKQEKIHKQRIKRQKKQEMKDQHVQTIFGEYNQVHQKREDMLNEIQEINSQTQQLKAKMDDLKANCKSETDKAQTMYDHLVTALDDLQTNIMDYIEEKRGEMEKMKEDF